MKVVAYDMCLFVTDKEPFTGFVSSKGPPPGQTKKKLQAAVVVTRDVAR